MVYGHGIYAIVCSGIVKREELAVVQHSANGVENSDLCDTRLLSNTLAAETGP